MRVVALLFVTYLLVLFKLLFFKLTVNISDIAISGNEGVSFRRLLADSNFIPFYRILYYLRGEEPYEVGILNLAGNIVLFVPMGIFLPYFVPRLRRVGPLLTATAAGSFLVEVLQLLTATGQFDVDDVLLNTAGAFLGLCVYRWWQKAFVRER